MSGCDSVKVMMIRCIIFQWCQRLEEVHSPKMAAQSNGSTKRNYHR